MPTIAPTPPDQLYDSLIIGAGPGGLTAAIYLRRFLRSVAIIDKGHSRLALIPRSHNYPGFPDGVPGRVLLENLRQQLLRYGTAVTPGEISGLTRRGEYFVATRDGSDIRARTVVLASGIADGGLPIEGWREAVASGSVRLCPVCDGFDALDKRIAVVSSERNRIAHALFMRTYSSEVALFERADDARLDQDELRQLRDAGVRYIASPLQGITFSAAMAPVLHTKDGEHYRYDVVYPMLGETARSTLATGLGAASADCAELLTDEHQCTSVPGLFAIGDVTRGLNQISVATGQAAVAATAIHNSLPPQPRASDKAQVSRSRPA